MRRLLIALAVIGLWFIGGRAEASQNCWAIKSADERAYCRAVQAGSKGQCAAIQSYDLRAQCFVRLGSPDTICATVKPGWPRLQCQDAKRN